MPARRGNMPSYGVEDVKALASGRHGFVKSPWEVVEFLSRQAERRDIGHQLAVCSGHRPERELVAAIGTATIEQPRVDHRRLTEAGQGRLSSAHLPRYARRVPSGTILIPVLYLKGASSGTSARRCRRSWEVGRRTSDTSALLVQAWLTYGDADDGVETGAGRPKDVAPADGVQTHPSRDGSASIRR